MRTIARLFGKSPFGALQTHMEKVTACVKLLDELMNAFMKQDYATIESLAKTLSELEHEADITKNDIRNHLPKSLFLPVDRHQLLEILAIQDSIADTAEKIGHLMVLYKLKKNNELFTAIHTLFQKNMEAFYDTKVIVDELDTLLEASFGGIEAERVKMKVDETAYKDYESTRLKQALLKEVFSQEESLSYCAFYLWTKLIERTSDLGNISEKLANRIRTILEIK